MPRFSSVPVSSTVAPGFTRLDAVDADERRQLVPAVERRRLGGRDLRERVAFAGARRPHLQARHRPGVGRARHPLEHDRQGVGDRRAGVAALGERPRAAEHQQPAAAPLDELRHHPQLIAGERAGLDAAENQAAVGEQLVARLGKRRRRAAPACRRRSRYVLVVRRAQERDDLQVLVLVDGAVQELHLGPRLALEVEDLLGAIVDVDQRLALVVLRDELAGPRRDPEPEHARAGIRRREAHAHRRRLAVDRQLHFLRPDDAAFVLDVERHRLAGVAGLRDERVDHQRRALERASRGADTRSIWTSLVSDSRPSPTVNTGTSAAFIASSASDSSASVVSAPSLTTTSPASGRPGELLPRAVERRADLRLRAAEASSSAGDARRCGRATRTGRSAARTGSTAP